MRRVREGKVSKKDSSIPFGTSFLLPEEGYAPADELEKWQGEELPREHKPEGGQEEFVSIDECKGFLCANVFGGWNH